MHIPHLSKVVESPSTPFVFLKPALSLIAGEASTYDARGSLVSLLLIFTCGAEAIFYAWLSCMSCTNGYSLSYEVVPLFAWCTNLLLEGVFILLSRSSLHSSVNWYWSLVFSSTVTQLLLLIPSLSSLDNYVDVNTCLVARSFDLHS